MIDPPFFLEVTHRNGINGVMRARAMSAFATHFNDEVLAERRLRPRRDADVTHGQSRINVKREDGARAFDSSLRDHLASTAAGFLRRLKNTSPGHGQFAGAMQRHRGPKQNGGMRIVPAGVHHSVVFGAIENFIFLGGWQGIDIGTQGDDRSCRMGGGRDVGDDPFFPSAQPKRDFGGGEFSAQIRSGCEFRAAQFRMLVKLAANDRQPGRDAIRFGGHPQR